jgi:heme exporter protein D
MRNLDFSSWQALLSTLLGLAVITLIGVGIRLIVMQTIQQRRERENRQINERLRTLIAAYKTLGGSFTGNLAVDPAHLRDLRLRDHPITGSNEPADLEMKAHATSEAGSVTPAANDWRSSDRSRRIRDAVEAALSDIILLGTEEQVQLAAAAATELAAGRPAHTAELVVSLRNFIRQVLDLDAVPTHLAIPKQGPARPSAARGGGKNEGGGKDGANQGGGKGAGAGGGAAAGAGAGMGMGLGLGGHSASDEETDDHR